MLMEKKTRNGLLCVGGIAVAGIVAGICFYLVKRGSLKAKAARRHREGINIPERVASRASEVEAFVERRRARAKAKRTQREGSPD